MSLPTAPCTHCRQRIVYGQRRCPACGTTFDYGPTPPPEPTPAQVQEALMLAGGQPISVPSGAPVVDEAFVDRGRYDEQSSAPVATEQIPGFIDSTLFKAFTPDVVETTRVEGLEQTAYDGVGAAVPTEYVPVEHTAQAPVGQVAREEIPGFIDSTLFKAFTPDVVQTEGVEGLEVSPGASARPRPAKKRADSDEGPQPCRDCGTKHERSVCPACGARR